jgi:hypothetical protein
MTGTLTAPDGVFFGFQQEIAFTQLPEPLILENMYVRTTANSVMDMAMTNL